MSLCIERALSSARWPARWQLLLHRWRSGAGIPREVGCGHGEVAVIAKVRDPAAWQASSDFRPGMTLGRIEDEDAWLITGRVALAGVERLLEDPGLLELEGAIPLHPLVEESTLELGAQPVLLPSVAAANGGAGAVVGIVDSSINCQHGNLRDAHGRPRVAVTWRQGAAARCEPSVDYGTVYDRRELWLAADDMAAGECDSHAMRMLDMAAGNGLASGAAGVAPRAEMMHVDLSAAQRRPCRQNLGDTVRLVEGVKFIFDHARHAPCAVNISLGTSAGGHDGRSLAEQALDVLATAAPNRAIVVAAGNNFAAEQHASSNLTTGEACELTWHVPVSGRMRHSVELWYGAENELEIELVAPRGCGGCRLDLGTNGRLVDDVTGRTVALVVHESTRSGDRVATVFLERGAPAGVWGLVLKGHRVADGRFHAWIVPEDPVRPVFLSHVDTSCTLNALACGRHTIAVGAYDARRPHLPLGWYSSAGPTRDGRPKPDVSAPGHRVWVARADRAESSVECSGTSLAAAAGTGVAALVLAHAAARGLTLSAAALANILTDTARLHPPAGGWDDRYGYGRLDAATAIYLVEQLAAARQDQRVSSDAGA